MLNIPAEIQTLFKTDSVRKNFRVHFPNGENADLTNADIVAGSVKFTESVCSKDVLQFGLAEASRIEFECVNVPNIYGAVIECYCEIDATDADAQYQTTMPDLDYPVYQIPYGVFTVTSCPRSSGAMWKRRVEAYAREVTNSTMSYQLKNKMANGYPDMINIPLMMAQELNSVASIQTTESTVSMTSTSFTVSDATLGWNYGGDAYLLTCNMESKSYYMYATTTDMDSAYRFTCTANTSGIDAMYEDLLAVGISSKYMDIVRNAVEPGVVIGGGGPGAWAPIYHNRTVTDSGIIYPYIHNAGSHEFTAIVYPNDSRTITLSKNGSVLQTYTISPYISSPTLKKYKMTDSASLLLNIHLEPSQDDSGTKSWANSLDLGSCAQGYAELNASFIRCDRMNALGLKSLSKSSPVAMSTDEYSSLWWDEYDISPIGSVTLSYKDIDLNQEQTITYDFGSGASEYDMTSNYLLKNLAVSVNDLTNQTVEEFVTGLLDTYFIPNISDIAFTPAQLDSLGLPYLEAGDYLEIDDGNGNTVGTYIMSRTLSGEQFLEDEIESKGGEIIGNVRSA